MDLFDPGSHGSTFGGSPFSSAVALAALTAIEMENLPVQAEEKGRYVMQKLRAVAAGSSIITQVRGKGLMIGIELRKGGPNGHDIAEKLYEEGLILKDTHEWVLRFTPPIVSSIEELDIALAAIDRVLGR